MSRLLRDDMRAVPRTEVRTWSEPGRLVLTSHPGLEVPTGSLVEAFLILERY